jgi:hypothetical protein
MAKYQAKIQDSLVGITYDYCKKNNLTGSEAKTFVRKLLQNIQPEARPTITAITMGVDRRLWKLTSL